MTFVRKDNCLKLLLINSPFFETLTSSSAFHLHILFNIDSNPTDYGLKLSGALTYTRQAVELERASKVRARAGLGH